MKTAISSYSFYPLVKSGDMKQIEVIEAAAKLGYEQIEFAAILLEPEEELLDFAAKAKAEAKRCGIEIVNYSVGADFLRNDWQQEARRLFTHVDAAQIMGACGMRHDATAGFPEGYAGPNAFEDALPTLIDACRMVAQYAQGKSVKTMVENHGFFCQDSERVAKLYEGVDHPNFGLLVDIGNFLCADEEPIKAVGWVAQYACHAHVKDFHKKPGGWWNPGAGWFGTRGGNLLRGAVLGHGDVAVLACLRQLAKAGYDGSLVVEFEGIEEPMKAAQWSLDNLRKLIALI